MSKRWFLLTLLAALGAPGTSAAQYPVSWGPLPPGYSDPPAYGMMSGYHANGLGWTLGYVDIYDSRPWPVGWYWPNVHWPSRDYHFTYRAGPDTYRVFYPSLTAPRANSYIITTPGASTWVTGTGQEGAQVEVRVPTENAVVLIEGVRMSTRGLTRLYATPALTPGSDYSYEITVRWLEDGQEQTQTKKVAIRNGEVSRVSFGLK